MKKKTRRNPQQVEALLKQVRILRRAGKTWSAIARELKCGRSWLMTVKKEREWV